MRAASAGRRVYFGSAAVALAAGIAAGWAYWWQSSARRAPAATNSYVDSARCTDCHKAIADSFRKTGMGRSFSRLRPENTLDELTPGKTYYHKASDTHFATIKRGGDYFQRRWQIGFDGKETNVDEKRVDYVIGSGNHSRTYLHLTSRNTLRQLPLHWYAEKGGVWAMSPGYDRPDHPGSTRLVGYECMFCHNAYPKIPEGHEKAGAERVYLQPLPEGIDCQRCHGPGKRHADLAATAGSARESIRSSIVNPGRLTPERAMEVCMQCHLHTTAFKLPASIVRADRGPFSYVPGQALGDFRLSFDATPGRSDRFENLSSAYRLRKSPCFLGSAGKLICTTCHDPHNIPRGTAATAHYNGICRSCHADAIEPAQLHLRPAGAPAAGCINCHMPKRRTDDEVHVVMTDHYIQRKLPAGDLLAEKAETHETPATGYRGEVVLFYPPRLPDTVENSLELAAAQIRDGSNLSGGLPRLTALLEKHRPSNARYYADLADGHLAAGDSAKAIHYYREAVRRSPGSAFLMTKLGNALTEARQFSNAEETLLRATALAPGDALAWGALGWALWQQDKAGAARMALEKGAALDPESPELHNRLASLLGGIGDIAAAENELRAALRILPGIAEWQLNLGRLLANRGAFSEARYRFERAVRFKPGDAAARLDYARLLAAMNDLNGAARELEIAARGTDPQAKAGAEQLLRRLGR